jgi:hypothetical protein
MTQTDADLLTRAKRDPEAICVLFDRHAEGLVAGLRGGGASHELALDVVQETFARLLEDSSRVRAVDASASRRLGIALASSPPWPGHRARTSTGLRASSPWPATVTSSPARP